MEDWEALKVSRQLVDLAICGRSKIFTWRQPSRSKTIDFRKREREKGNLSVLVTDNISGLNYSLYENSLSYHVHWAFYIFTLNPLPLILASDVNFCLLIPKWLLRNYNSLNGFLQSISTIFWQLRKSKGFNYRERKWEKSEQKGLTKVLTINLVTIIFIVLLPYTKMFAFEHITFALQ